MVQRFCSADSSATICCIDMLFKCDATDLLARQMRCNRFARSTNAMQPICSLYKCDATDLLALKKGYNRIAHSTNAMQPICSLDKCDATDLLARQMRCNRFARSTNAMQPICSLDKCDATDLLAQIRRFAYQNERVPEQRYGNILNKLEPIKALFSPCAQVVLQSLCSVQI
jgi:hypothetical protein